MTPPNPKRPPRSSRPEGDSGSRTDTEVELPFDDDEVAPLQADDPRPQRVPQFPATQRRPSRRGARASGARDTGVDRELATRFNVGEYSDAGFRPIFFYVEQGPGAGQLIPLKQGSLVLGRSSASDLRLQHPSISRRHAQVSRQGDRVVLRDLGSQNGTFLNRSRIFTEVELRHGDLISIGNALLRLRAPSPSSPEANSVSVTLARELLPRRRLPRRVLLALALGLALVLLTVALR